jgi:hypothetical protein
MVLYINLPLSHGTIKCKKRTLYSDNPTGLFQKKPLQSRATNPVKTVLSFKIIIIIKS